MVHHSVKAQLMDGAGWKAGRNLYHSIIEQSTSL